MSVSAKDIIDPTMAWIRENRVVTLVAIASALAICFYYMDKGFRMIPGPLTRPVGNGTDILISYLSQHVITCLIPAFFIAGGIGAFLSQASVLKYFNSTTKKYISYSIASVSGIILAVCSCTVIPLFTGIYKRGAGIGPATTFLFAGPAINVLAIVYTANALGYDIGLARAVSAISMSVVVGLLMAFIFRKDARGSGGLLLMEEQHERHFGWTILFFVMMVAILVVLTAGFLPMLTRVVISYIITIFLGVLLVFKYSRDEVKLWGKETWSLSLKIFPLLIVGTFITGILAYYLPMGLVRNLMGTNSLLSTFIASIIGALLYMPTLLEVPIIGELFGYSSGVMSPGAALSLLLAGPSLSLPNMMVITKVMGIRRAGAYITIVVLLSTIAGFIYGNMMEFGGWGV